MTRTAYVDWPTGQNLYAKPRALTTADWAADKVSGSENGATGEYSFAAISETVEYVLYSQAGEIPASTDTKIGYIEGGVALTDSAKELVANAVWESETRTLSSFGNLVADIRDAILNRVLAGNHDTAGTVGKIIQAIAAKTGLLGTGSVTVGAPVADNGSIAILYQGDDYAGSRALTFTFNSSGFDLSTGATSLFEAEPVQGCSFAAAGTMVDNEDGTATATISITSDQSDLLETGPVSWSALNITAAGLRETVTKGRSPLERRKHG